jgi:hypothetical protein
MSCTQQGDTDMIERSTDQTLTELVCKGCNRTIEWCSFCDRTDCAVAVCYGCMLVDLRESIPQPHAHGG